MQLFNSSSFGIICLVNHFEMEFDLFKLHQNEHLPMCILMCLDDPLQCIRLEHQVLKLMGRADTRRPHDEAIPLLQIVAMPDLIARTVQVKVVEEGLSFFNEQEMDPYEKYILADGDEITFMPDKYTYALHFIDIANREYPLR